MVLGVSADQDKAVGMHRGEGSGRHAGVSSRVHLIGTLDPSEKRDGRIIGNRKARGKTSERQERRCGRHCKRRIDVVIERHAENESGRHGELATSARSSCDVMRPRHASDGGANAR